MPSVSERAQIGVDLVGTGREIGRLLRLDLQVVEVAAGEEGSSSPSG